GHAAALRTWRQGLPGAARLRARHMPEVPHVGSVCRLPGEAQDHPLRDPDGLVPRAGGHRVPELHAAVCGARRDADGLSRGAAGRSRGGGQDSAGRTGRQRVGGIRTHVLPDPPGRCRGRPRGDRSGVQAPGDEVPPGSLGRPRRPGKDAPPARSERVPLRSRQAARLRPLARDRAPPAGDAARRRL
ncbi:MAG: Chaperone protein DnaJ, partial [uncultured Thermomicrobiales bacterium]